jgi:drug/metabolite transporter (DMT)-like permease
MSWQILLIISVVTYVISNVLQRVLLKEDSTDPIAFAILFQFLVGTIIGLYALVRGIEFPANLTTLLPNLLLMAGIYVAANIFLYRSLKITPVSEFTILFSTSTFWTIIGAIILLGESFTKVHFVGTLLILGGLLIVFKTSKKMKLSKGHVGALVSAALFGLAFVNDAYVLKSFEVNTYVSLAFLLPTALMLLIYPRSVKEMKVLLRKDKLQKLLIIVVFYSISAIAIFTAYTVGNNAAVISAINKTSSIFIVLAGIVFLHERENIPRKILGACIATLGVILLVI